MRFRYRRLALAGAVGAVLLGMTPGPAAADVAGPVVLLGTGGLRWSDVGSRTPALERVLDQDASGWLAVRSVRSITCPVDGWLAVSAGRRAADRQTDQDEPNCREPQPAVDTAGEATTVPHWSEYRAAATADSFDATVGLLGSALRQAGLSSAAVGPGAAIALADEQGQVTRAWPGRVDGAAGPVSPTVLVDDVRAALKTDPKLLVVDLGAIIDPARATGQPGLTGAYTRTREQQVAALDARLGPVLAELPATASVLIASIADVGRPSKLQLLAARGPAPLGGSYTGSLLGSRSTRQDGLAQTTDLLPTLLTALSVPVPPGAVGSAITPVPGQPSPAERRQQLDDVAGPSAAVAPLGPWLTNTLIVLQLLLYAGATLVLRRRAPSPSPTETPTWSRAESPTRSRAGSPTETPTRSPSPTSIPAESPAESPAAGDSVAAAIDPGRARALGRLQVVAVVLASFPVASYLANLLPWWRAGAEYLALTGSVLAFMIVISALALYGPGRRSALGPLTVVAGVTAAVLALDALTGSHLLLSSLLFGVQPTVAGRFYGFGNSTFALFATAGLLVATALADRLVRAGRRYPAAAAVAGLGIVATVIDGTPGIGSDFGGPPALVPAFAVLVLLVAGVRVTWRRALLIATLTITVLLALGLLDWLRAPGDRTHLGRFVQAMIDGDAGPVIGRKGTQNLRILFFSYLSAMLPFAVGFVYFVLARPSATGASPLRTLFERAPVLRAGLISFVVMMVIAAALNDSGTAVPAFATMLLLPLLIAVCARAELVTTTALDPTEAG